MTSFAPRNIVTQVAALGTWREVFDEIIAFNSEEERDRLIQSGLVHGVTFFDEADFVSDLYQKPYVSLASVLDFSRGTGPDTVFVLLNSDIQLNREIKEFLQLIPADAIYYSNRVEHSTQETHKGAAYLNGIDLFAWRGGAVNGLQFPRNLALGIPFWDLIFPVAALRLGLKLVRLPLRLTLHVSHPQRWGEFYTVAGEAALRYLTAMSLDDYLREIDAKPELFIDDPYTDTLTRPLLLAIYALSANIEDVYNNKYSLIMDEYSRRWLFHVPEASVESVFIPPYETRIGDARISRSFVWNCAAEDTLFSRTHHQGTNHSPVPFSLRRSISLLIGDLFDHISGLARWAALRSAELRRPVGLAFMPTLDYFYGETDKVVGITSLFKSGPYLDGLLKNIDGYERSTPLHWLVMDCNNVDEDWEANKIARHVAANNDLRVTIVRLGYDPGLYNVWINGIAISRSEYITNINTDDLRAPEHIGTLVSVLDLDPNLDVVCSALRVFRDPALPWDSLGESEVWFAGESRNLATADLFQVKRWVDSSPVGPLTSQNIPHCMPVWRRKLHDRVGYFDEASYSSVADWEFWLRVLQAGGQIRLHGVPLGAYYWNPNSYNRVDARVDAAVQRILQTYCTAEVMRAIGLPGRHADSVIAHQFMEYGEPSPVIRVDTPSMFYGEHRTGWQFVVGFLKDSIHDEDSDLQLEPFLEKKFGWGTDPGDINHDPQPLDSPWIGIAHVPMGVPNWFQSQLSLTRIRSTRMWARSVPHLKGLVALSRQHASALRREFRHKVPVHFVKHPTDLDVARFSIERYRQKSPQKVVQVGVWLRKMHAIGHLPPDSHERILLMKPYVREMLDAEAYVFGLDSQAHLSGVKLVEFLPDEAYDELLTESVLFCDLYDTSANNLVLEALARHTPILVRRHPAVVDYLGDDYPMYYRSYEDAGRKLRDHVLVEEAHNYLRELPKADVTPEFFASSLTWFVKQVRSMR